MYCEQLDWVPYDKPLPKIKDLHGRQMKKLAKLLNLSIEDANIFFAAGFRGLCDHYTEAK